ncbi:hypothetical protein GCM10010405_33990 [Streptomyces macrosporus]|uniref:Uncharacterized protein n=1 Tax=Streptomyces macrosporus TaxID=44032 RepID=A0ABN3K2T1_9ACTN
MVTGVYAEQGKQGSGWKFSQPDPCRIGGGIVWPLRQGQDRAAPRDRRLVRSSARQGQDQNDAS